MAKPLKFPPLAPINTVLAETDAAVVLQATAPAAAATFRDMRQKLSDLRAMRMQVGDEIDFHRTRKIEAEGRVQRLKLAWGAGGPNLADDDLQVREAQGAVERHAAEMARLSQLNAGRDAVAQNLSQLFNRCEDLVRHRPRNTVIRQVPPPEIASVLKKNETPAAALDRLRLRLRELGADEHRVRSAPFPSSYAKTRMRAMVEQRMQEPDLTGLIEHDAGIRWPMTRLEMPLVAVGQNQSPVIGSSAGEVIDILAVLAWLDPARLVAKLSAEIDAVADDEAAMTHEQRQVKLAEIEADRIAIEREECAVIRHMQAQGMTIEYRADTDPRAVLSVELETVAA